MLEKVDIGLSRPDVEKTRPKAIRKITIFTLFSFASKVDCILIFLATLCSIATGALMPVFFIFVDALLEDFGKYQLLVLFDPATANANLKVASVDICTKVFMLAVSGIVFGYFQMLLWTIVGENQVLKIRKKCYKSILSQDMGWFDVSNSFELAQTTNDIMLIQEGISDKLGSVIQYLANFVISYIVAFSLGWKLSLVVISIIPIIGITGFFMASCTTTNSIKSQKLYGEVSSLTDEVLSSVRTVYAFNGQQQANSKLEDKLKAVEKFGYFKAIVNGVGLGLIQFVIFSSFSASLYYGSRLIEDKEYDVQTVFNVLLILLMGSVNVGLSATNFSAVSTAVGVGVKVFQVIERESKINPFLAEQSMIDKQNTLVPIVGQIELRDVTFLYPSRSEAKILKNVDLLIEAGSTVAIVGPSGSGKSTIISLIERFYDPNSGTVFLDEVDISQISVKFLRNQIGLVSQEPVLFSLSIRENVLLGLSDDLTCDKEADELNLMVEDACKKANIHKFIMNLPNQYETLVGEKGSQLSGGQKQCIAIARAIIKNPSILLLDEATSALDTESEGLVQKALDNASKGRTTVVVAHRLSTIRNADKIVVIENGIVKEIGNHGILMAKKGLYSELVKSQSIDITDHIKTPKLSVLNSPHSKISAEFRRTFSSIAEYSESNESYEVDDEVGNESSQQVQTLMKKSKSKQIKFSPTLRLFKIASPWWYLLASGFFGAILEGAILPFFSIVFTNILQSFYNLKDPTKHDKGSKDIILWSLMFVAVGVTSFVSNVFRVSSFEAVGESVVTVVRKSTFATYLKQEIAYYDEPKNQVSNLSSRLATDSEEIPKVISKVISPIITCISALVIGLTIAFVSAWKMALVGMICLPFYTFTFLIQYIMFNSSNKKVKKTFLKISKTSIDSIINIKTLAGLVKEEKFYEDYEKVINASRKGVIKGALSSSLGFGFSLGAQFFVYGTLYWFGTKFLIDGDYTFIQMFQALTASLFIGVPIAQVTTQINCYSKSRLAAINFFNLMDRKPPIDSSEEYGLKPALKADNILLEDGNFSYPTRPDIEVLKDISIRIMAGKRTAIVGSSGSGKSTLISLILRFYDLQYGKIFADGTEVKDWNLPLLRSHIAVVSQEPVLFDTSISENIRYGKLDATQTEIEEAAKMANAHKFITELPFKYNTKVGPGGSQLSGGQKQRIAIARALINNPKLLLLDEATSALDSESEKVVQQALKSASENRTTIAIAHRLSTIQDYDHIICMREGSVVERGNHKELLALKGYYYSLVFQQQFSS